MEWDDDVTLAFVTLWRDARERHGLTQAVVADRLGMTQATISQLERGPYVGMRFIDIAKLASFYGIALDEIAALLGVGKPVETSTQRGLDVLLSSVSDETRSFVTRVVETLLKGLR